MIHVDIKEIENGFVVELFNSDGPTELDKTVFAKSLDEVLKVISDWYKEEKESTHKTT